MGSPVGTAIKAQTVVFLAFEFEPACTFSSAWPRSDRAIAPGSRSRRLLRRRDFVQSRRRGYVTVSPAGRCTTALRTGEGTPNSPPL